MIRYITTQEEIDSVFQKSSVNEMLEYFKDHTEIQVDTETTGYFNFKNEILLLQLGDEENQYVLNFPELSKGEKDAITEKILLNKDMCKILHNAKFDIKFLWHHGMDIVNVYDTMLAEILLNAGKKTPDGFYSLYGAAIRYCGVRLKKEVRGKINKYGINTAVIKYAAEDVKYLSRIKEQQVKKLREFEFANDDLQDIYTLCGLEMNAVLAFAALEYNGIKLNMDKWKIIKKECAQNVEDTKNDINRIIWEEPKLEKFRSYYQDLFTPAYKTTKVNWASPQQKLNVLQTLFPEIEDTSERTLSRYKRKHPIFKALIDYNKANKLNTAFALKLPKTINPVTKRIHTSFWQILDTGRISSKNPKYIGRLYSNV